MLVVWFLLCVGGAGLVVLVQSWLSVGGAVLVMCL